MKLINKLISALLFIASSFLSAEAMAVVVFDNGGVGAQTNWCISGPGDCLGTGNWTIYDNFSLSNAVQFNGFTNWNANGNASEYVSTIWSLWTTNPGLGGSAIASGNSFASITSNFGFIQASVSGLSVSLAAGNYWLGINHQVSSNTPWTYVASASGAQDAIQKDGGSYVHPALPDMAFTIDAIVSPVPEPQTYAMLLAGLGLLGFSARRRNNNAA